MISVVKIQSIPFLFNPIINFFSPVQRGDSNSKARAMNGASYSSTFLVSSIAFSQVDSRIDSGSIKSIFLKIFLFRYSNSFSVNPVILSSFFYDFLIHQAHKSVNKNQICLRSLIKGRLFFRLDLRVR